MAIGPLANWVAAALVPLSATLVFNWPGTPSWKTELVVPPEPLSCSPCADIKCPEAVCANHTDSLCETVLEETGFWPGFYAGVSVPVVAVACAWSACSEPASVELRVRRIHFDGGGD